jgi:hypothetical protein
VAYRRIETGFDVRPVIRETLAEVEIVPRISEIGSGGDSGVVHFAEAATRIHAPLEYTRCQISIIDYSLTFLMS